jgi:hypothetical protein
MQDYVGALHHIYKFLPPGEQYHSCEKLTQCILEKTGRLADVAAFVEICLYDALVGNNDRHGRNLGIIETSKGKFLSPMYDNPSYLGIVEKPLLGAHFSVSGAIYTEHSKKPKLIDYIVEFDRLGHKRVVDQFKSRAISKNSEIMSFIGNTPICTQRKKAFIDFIDARVGDLENA